LGKALGFWKLAMAGVNFQPRSGESILVRIIPGRKWYVIAWKISSGVLGISLITLVFFTLFSAPTQGHLNSFLPAWAVDLLVKLIFLGVVPLGAIFWVVEDLVCTFIGQVILTDQRILIHGLPYAWSQEEISLDEISSMTWRRDAIFIKQNSTRRIQVLMISDGKLIVKAYDRLVSKAGVPQPVI
jgi:hypothetical protein